MQRQELGVNGSQATKNLLPAADEKPEKTGAPSFPQISFYEAYFQGWWLFELGSLALGTAAFIALTVLLNRHQNKVVPEISSIAGVGITLNTVVSILATVGRACMLLPVAECISQQKWLWFSGSPRALTHLDTFDQGSRGAFGSMAMLWTVNVRNLGSMGALLLIVGLAVDPLSQQLLHYEKRLEPARFGEYKDAYVGRVAAYGDSILESTVCLNSIDDEKGWLREPPLFVQAAVQTGLYDNHSGVPDLAPFCPTGNCTWSPYSSLAVCFRWADVSSKLQRSAAPMEWASDGPVEVWSLNNRSVIGAFEFQAGRLNLSNLAEVVDRPDAPNYLEFPGTSAFNDSSSPIADFFVTYRNGSGPDRYSGLNFSAIEFVLEWCVQEYKTEVKSGVPTTTKLKATKDFPHTDSRGLRYMEMANGDRYFLPDSLVDSHLPLPGYLRRTFTGPIFYGDGSRNLTVPTTVTKTSGAAEAFHSKLRADPWDYPTGPEDPEVRTAMVQVVQNVATSITNVMRQQSNETVYGIVWKEQTFVKVQWGWLAAPAILTSFSVLFVVATIIQSSGQAKRGMLWKSSSVPTLLTLNPDLHEAIGGPSSLSETTRVLRGAKASLSRDKQEGWKLYGS